MVYNNPLELIGNTPIIKLSKMVDENSADVYVKLEKNSLTGSVKDRAALNMIIQAEELGLLKKGGTIVEPTSGNTGIALALIGKLKGYRVIIVMPDTMSEERRQIIKAYGAELVLTEGAKGMTGSIEKALEMAKEDPNYFVPQQFSNKFNAQIHEKTTALEIIKDIPDIKAFVAGVGTGGTISGTGKKLKEYNSNIKVYAVEPKESAVISTGKSGPHKIQGIGAGFVTDIYNKDVVDEVITITAEESFKIVKELVEKEGLFLGISSGASIGVALQLAKGMKKGEKVVAIAPDGGEKYLSTGIFN
ncbi:MAG: cysteine synthase A [Fusobacteriaceae bacterium]|nr:cysteine synthase A [Fusobacteriaceae bacterium]MBP9510425.1 cysteine synthase A [Fusobacteriaceae bacterium]